MALGFNYSSDSNSGDIVGFVKYDARAGRFFRNDRTQENGNYVNNSVDITSKFKAVIDMENIEVGYSLFAAGGAPQHLLVKLGSAMPAKPIGGEKWKQSVRIMIKLSKECGGDIREITSNATAFLKGFDGLHTEYLASKSENPGKLPIIGLESTSPVTSGSGDRKSTNYRPVFYIAGWIARPSDLVHVSKISKPAATQQPTPPTTGSTKVDAPVIVQKQQTEMLDDFG